MRRILFKTSILMFFYVKIIYFVLIYIKEDAGNPSFVHNAKQR